MSWKVVHDFESLVSSWFGAKYGVAVDSCTHGVELCLRLKGIEKISIPKRTYLSIPFLSHKLGLPLEWRDESWEDYFSKQNFDVVTGASITSRSIQEGVYKALLFYKENKHRILFTKNES